MDSTQLLYFKQQLEKGVREILASQRAIASNHLRHTGQERIGSLRGGKSRGQILMEELAGASHQVTASAAGVVAETLLPLRVRFLDMKHLGNLRIYNRQVWGTLYGRTLGDIKYEYRERLRSRVSAALSSPTAN